MREWPEWWNYELVLSPHMIERMQDRKFSELDLRTMLNDAQGYHPSVVSGRFLIESRRARQRWEIVVEPDEFERTLIVITAYGVE